MASKKSCIMKLSVTLLSNKKKNPALLLVQRGFECVHGEDANVCGRARAVSSFV